MGACRPKGTCGHFAVALGRLCGAGLKMTKIEIDSIARFGDNSPRPIYGKEEVVIMGKIVECAKVDPSSGCKHVIRGQTEEEVLKNAAEHAKQHGIREVTPELKAKVKAAIRDEK